MIELRSLEENDSLMQGYRSSHPKSKKGAKFQVGPFYNVETHEDITCTYASMTITQQKNMWWYGDGKNKSRCEGEHDHEYGIKVTVECEQTLSDNVSDYFTHLSLP